MPEVLRVTARIEEGPFPHNSVIRSSLVVGSIGNMFIDNTQSKLEPPNYGWPRDSAENHLKGVVGTQGWTETSGRFFLSCDLCPTSSPRKLMGAGEGGWAVTPTVKGPKGRRE